MLYMEGFRSSLFDFPFDLLLFTSIMLGPELNLDYLIIMLEGDNSLDSSVVLTYTLSKDKDCFNTIRISS